MSPVIAIDRLYTLLSEIQDSYVCLSICHVIKIWRELFSGKGACYFGSWEHTIKRLIIDENG